MENVQLFVSKLWKRTLLAFMLVFSFSSCEKQSNQIPPVLYPGYQHQKVGASTNDILSERKFSSLTVELQYMKGSRPEVKAVAELKTFLKQHVHKSGGVKIVLSELDTSITKILNIDDVRKIEDQHRKLLPINNRLTIYILITNGSHSDPNYLGMAYRNTSAVLFGGTIQQHSGYKNILTKAELEASVLRHEMGHLMGLGIEPLAASSRKKSKGKHHHCENEMCLMFHATETRKLSFINRKGKIPQLDENCRQILMDNGGGNQASISTTDSYFLSGF